MLNIIKRLLNSEKITTTKEIHDRIVSGDLTVDYGKFFIGLGNPEKYLLKELSKMDTWYINFRLRCFIVDDVGLFLDEANKVVKFHQFSYDDNPEYTPIEIDDDIEEVFEGSFDLPSGIIFLANNFSEKVNPEPENEKRFGDLSLNTYQGRKRITKWYLDNNKVAYGQMGNMGLTVYYNEKTKHIILGENMDWLEDKSKSVLKYEKILKDYKDMGHLSLSYWRWEAADSQTILSQSTLGDEKEIIEIPTGGTKARFEHYYNTLNKSPLTEHCYAQIWIE